MNGINNSVYRDFNITYSSNYKPIAQTSTSQNKIFSKENLINTGCWTFLGSFMGGLIPMTYYEELTLKPSKECFNKVGKPGALIGGVSAFIFSIYENKNNLHTFNNDYEKQQRAQALLNKTLNGLSIIA